MALQVSVAVWGDVPKVAVVGREHVRPEGVDGEAERSTVPRKPLTPVKVMVEVPEASGSIWAGETASAAMVKSVTLKITSTVCGPAEMLVEFTVTS